MSVLRRVIRVLLPILALGAGLGVLILLVRTRPAPEKKPREERGALVEARKVKSVREKLRIVAHGTVIPEKQVTLQPEVAGRVVWQHPELVPGGRFEKGATLVRVDPRDYALAMQQNAAQVQRAQLELKMEQARQDVARREWEIIGEDRNASELGRDLALRRPQLDVARSNVQAAESSLGQAKLAVGKTTLRAPFSGFVKAEAVDVGQLVTPQNMLATLVGSEKFWVQVSIPVDKLAWLDVPGHNAPAGAGAAAVITLDAGQRVERSGRLIRLLGDLDPVGRMARLLVEIDDPLGQSGNGARARDEPGQAKLPILLGAYVEVALEAHQIENVIELPRLALRGDDSVYVVGPDDRLVIRDVEVIWRRGDSVLVRKGLAPDERVITSRLPNAIPGMRLRVVLEAPEAPVGQR
jgi:RND family efflux transporter MFP subunit